MNNIEQLLTPKQVMDLLSISSSTLYAWRRKGLPHLKVNGTTIRYRWSNIQEWLSGQLIKDKPNPTSWLKGTRKYVKKIEVPDMASQIRAMQEEIKKKLED